ILEEAGLLTCEMNPPREYYGIMDDDVIGLTTKSETCTADDLSWLVTGSPTDSLAITSLPQDVKDKRYVAVLHGSIRGSDVRKEIGRRQFLILFLLLNSPTTCHEFGKDYTYIDEDRVLQAMNLQKYKPKGKETAKTRIQKNWDAFVRRMECVPGLK